MAMANKKDPWEPEDLAEFRMRSFRIMLNFPAQTHPQVGVRKQDSHDCSWMTRSMDVSRRASLHHGMQWQLRGGHCYAVVGFAMAFPAPRRALPGKNMIRNKRLVRSSFLRLPSVGTQKCSRDCFSRRSVGGGSPRPACGRAVRGKYWDSQQTLGAFELLALAECRDSEVFRTSLSGFTSPRLREEVGSPWRCGASPVRSG